MRAFRYVDGALREERSEQWQRPYVRIREPTETRFPVESLFLTPRERRRLARTGRRFPVRVSRWRPIPMTIAANITTLEAHTIGCGPHERFLLFLPSDEGVTARHLADMERAVSR